jgi:hypothetical protein
VRQFHPHVADCGRCLAPDYLLIPEVGLTGREKLAAARVLLVGAGGLGSPILAYLAAAGVGRIGLADDDVVDVTNLQRQILSFKRVLRIFTSPSHLPDVSGSCIDERATL